MPIRRQLLLGLACLSVACVPVTVNITFPQEKLDSAASQIVDMGRKPPAEAPPAAPKGPGSGLDRWLAPLAPPEAVAETRSIEVAQAPRTDTEEIRRLTAAQNARLGAVQQWMGRGCIGEGNQGLLEARPGQGCSGDVGPLMAAENRDRQAIIDAFMRQNNIPGSDASRVRASFTKAYRDRAQAGQWIQQENGQWVKK